MSGGRSFRRLPEIEHGFHVPLILNEVGGIFCSISSVGRAQGIKGIPDF